VVDDNAVIRQALCRVFTSEADFGVCGEAGPRLALPRRRV